MAVCGRGRSLLPPLASPPPALARTPIWLVDDAKAVIEALCNHQTAFVRTPKYGIGQANRSDWKKSSYKAMKTLTPFVELLFGFF